MAIVLYIGGSMDTYEIRRKAHGVSLVMMEGLLVGRIAIMCMFCARIYRPPRSQVRLGASDLCVLDGRRFSICGRPSCGRPSSAEWPDGRCMADFVPDSST